MARNVARSLLVRRGAHNTPSSWLMLPCVLTQGWGEGEGICNAVRCDQTFQWRGIITGLARKQPRCFFSMTNIVIRWSSLFCQLFLYPFHISHILFAHACCCFCSSFFNILPYALSHILPRRAPCRISLRTSLPLH